MKPLKTQLTDLVATLSSLMAAMALGLFVAFGAYFGIVFAAKFFGPISISMTHTVKPAALKAP